MPFSPPIRVLVVGSPGYLSKNGVPSVPDDLHRHQCIRSRLPSGSLYPWEFERAGQTVIINPRGQLTLDNNLMVAAAISGADSVWVSVW
ncbi:LysR substrate-binding domain-containing protein [Telluria aromaticivorans]|uniref:LysR substrate-binding domain-containing protein n=1 Tax=Telluria aromaticivorans TaxID=2725995 RepID=UPI0035307B9F